MYDMYICMDSEIFATHPEVKSWSTSENVAKKPYTRWNVHRTHHTEQALTHMLCLTVEKVAPSQFEIAILPIFHKIVIFIPMAFFLEENPFHVLPLEHLHAGAYPQAAQRSFCYTPDFLYCSCLGYWAVMLNVDQVLLSLGGRCFRSVLSVDTPNRFLELWCRINGIWRSSAT